MPRLSDLTDYNYDPMGSAVPAELPVDKPFKDLKKVYITGEEDLPVKFSDEPVKGDSGSFSNNVDKILNSLFRPDEKRLQLWPEKLLRSGTTAAGNVMSGEIPQWAVDPATGDVHTSPQMVEAAQEMSALAGTGGLGGTGGTLNATPSLRPALKHNGKLYKGKPGQEHMDVIPESMYPDFQKKAMNGEDIKDYNFGFINDKGHFLSREDALKYGIDNGLIDPQAGKFGALTSTLFADSSKPGAAIEAMKTANPFFSALEHNVKQISQSKMTGDQWLGTLGNKPGVKPEELQWTGLQDFLNENKGKPVTKAQIEEHLAANKVELKEVNKGAKQDSGELWDKFRQQGRDELIAKGADPKSPHFENQAYDRAERLMSEYEKNITTKYHSYQLPGGENYREMLMTLPKSGRAKFEAQQNEIIAKREKIQDEFDSLHGKEGPDVLSRRKELTNEFNNTVEDLRKLDLGAAERNNFGDYKSSHWDEPNILAHVRMNDRTIEGKKSLHLEEIQSDWHQQGREKGYKGVNEPLKKIPFDEWYKQTNIQDFDKLSPKAQELVKAKYEREGQNVVNPDASRVPDAPFKKSWHELALKRMLREASEKGYDRLSWTPGEAQAARYDLSKSISDLSYNPRTKTLVANDKNGSTVMQHKGVEPDKISDFVGKDVAKKLMETNYDASNPYSLHSLTNTDLKVGGEGMKGFYDQIIPKALEKLGKEHGVKVKQATLKNKDVEIDPADYFSSKRKHSLEPTVHYIDIPQSLKDTATQKGFPLFSKGGYMFQPVDFDPFAGKTELKT